MGRAEASESLIARGILLHKHHLFTPRSLAFLLVFLILESASLQRLFDYLRAYNIQPLVTEMNTDCTDFERVGILSKMQS
jgi:hypothetical protein